MKKHVRSVIFFFKNKSEKIFPYLFGVISGFLVFYFLYFFSAYGIQKGLSYSGHTHLFRGMSFGILTLVYITIFEVWIKPTFKIETIKHKVMWNLLLVIIGSHLVFILFNFFWSWMELNVKSYILILKEFPLMMILPIIFYRFLEYNLSFQLKENNYLVFKSTNNKDQLKIKIQDFLYANSSENYVSVCYFLNEEYKQHLIRKPLKSLEKELNAYAHIVRSHRSYLVNKSNVLSVKQAKGKVNIKIGHDNIPVSKKYHNLFLE